MLSHHHTLTGNPLTCKIILNIYCCLFNFLFLVEQIKTTPRIIVKTVLNLFIIFFKYSNSKKTLLFLQGFPSSCQKTCSHFPEIWRYVSIVYTRKGVLYLSSSGLPAPVGGYKTLEHPLCSLSSLHHSLNTATCAAFSWPPPSFSPPSWWPATAARRPRSPGRGTWPMVSASTAWRSVCSA